MSEYLWNQPMIFLIVLSGLYFLIRAKRVFSQNLHNESDLDFLMSHGEGGVRRTMLEGFLLQLPDSACFLSVCMLWAAIRVGGAGALFYFAAFSLLLKWVQGGVETLHHYYFPCGGVDGGVAMTLRASFSRKNLRGGKAASLLLMALEAAVLTLSVIPVALVREDSGCAGLSIRFAVLIVAGLILLLCVKKLPLLCNKAIPCLFLAFVVFSLAYNTGNLTLVLRIIITDAVELNSYVFRYSGMGLMHSVGAGAWLCAGSFLLRAYSPYTPKGAGLPHPVFYAVYAQLRSSFMTIVQLALGVLMLLFELEPAANTWVFSAVMCFVCFFSLRQIAGVMRQLAGCARRSAIVTLTAILTPLVYIILATHSMSAYFTMLSAALALAFAAVLIAALSDSGWYFALMEDYRDRYVWHSQPHPKL